MKRLFLARKIHEVMFVSEEKPDTLDLHCKAIEFLAKQDKEFDPPLVVTTISCHNDIPEGDWRGGALIWGADDLEVSEITATQFLDTYGDAEFQEYLRLKNKFEKRKNRTTGKK